MCSNKYTKIKVKKEKELLKEVEIVVTHEETELIMEFLYNFTRIVIRECFEISED